MARSGQRIKSTTNGNSAYVNVVDECDSMPEPVRAQTARTTGSPQTEPGADSPSRKERFPSEEGSAAAARGKAMARGDSCLTRVAVGVGVGGAVGGAVGAVYGTYGAIRYRIPGLLKIRHIGQATVGSAALFGLFLGAGSLIQCGKNY
ncbi:hypothetical protein ACQ4PT_060085 [Festuca glaucescens]